MLTDSSPLSLPSLRQSTAELLAYAICDVFPGTQLVSSGITNIDFYYDVIVPVALDQECLILLEEKMRFLMKAALPVKTLDMMRENAIQFLLHHKQPIKAEIIRHVSSNIVRLIQIEDFIDFCPLPYMTQTDQVGFFKLLNVTSMNVFIKNLGNLDVMRIRGTVFHEKIDLKNQLKRVEKAKKCDHWSIGLEMQLFAPIDEECFQWLPRGSALLSHLYQWLNAQQSSHGFEILEFPTILSNIFKSNLLTTIEINNQEFVCCPPSQLLPISPTSNSSSRYFGRSNHLNLAPTDQLQGLLNPRSGSFDLSQIFCNREQLQEELNSSLQFIQKIIKIIGFEHSWYLTANQNSTTGQEKSWNQSYNCLENALKESGLSYTIDKQIERRYGPRAELGITDASGREWRTSFISIDLLHRGVGDDLQRTPVPLRISRSVLGIMERFIGVLLEHFKGELPLWIAPEQIRIIPLSVKNADYTKNIQSQLETAGFRCKADNRPLALGERIHLAEKERIPYCVIVGEKEEQNDVITVRSSQKGQMKNAITIEFFLNQLQAALQEGHGVESK